ncbi:hypothetical protein [Pelagibacterium halotolerans]|uniref:hypothetical protein n=1 Tax=Pelagibacterium halotolerans TaxID=531813 RepID=UPI00384E6101
MKTTRTILGGAILALALTLSGPAWAQDDIDFGDNTSTWANDGECDDPRFEGEGAASVTSPVDQGRDAADCQAAYQAGTVTFVGEAGSTEAAPAEPPTPMTGDVDFGDDSGAWANDGECDDPRFGGMLDSHVMADATDCRTAFEAGEVTYLGEDTEMVGEIDFGDDSGEWANDGECDDPRFEGEGVGVALDSHYMADASDCETAYNAGTVTLAEEASADDGDMAVGEIDFGDDSGQWANDGECDDSRFEGDGMGVAMGSHVMADASDCQAAYEAGSIVYIGDQRATDPIVIDDIDFGDDSGNWANDGECDDPRFEGSGTGVALDDHLMADATDCSTAYQDGTVTLAPVDTGDVRINFGDDSGEYANDGECDDPRFEGPGMFDTALDSHLMADASDCEAAYNEGTVTLISEDGDDVRINFGDDSSDMAFDGVCDDPRFQGRGGAPELFAHNELADATDCRAAYDAGTVTYDPQ